ncbi:tripartite motif-containing protein 35 [Sarotherodon galilaeus]
MPKKQKKDKMESKSSQNDKIQDLASATDDHDYCLSDVELESDGGEKRNLEEMNDLLSDHSSKVVRPSPTTSDILAAIQALHVRFDKQDDKMADINNKLSENASLIANLVESIEFNAAEVRDCKDKIAGLEKEASTLRREVDELKEKARERDRYSRRWNLRIKGMKEGMGEDIRKEVIKILAKIAPEWSDNMEYIVDTVHWIGRKEEGRNRQVMIQFTKRLHRDGIWKKSKNAQICETEKIRFAEDLTKEDRLEREKVWPKILQARNAGEKAYYRGAVGYINGRRVLADG